MRHLIVAENFGIRLRPVGLGDSSFIVWLRNLNHVIGKVGDSAIDPADQQEWLEAYFERPGDYYFVIETGCGIPVGTYGLYNISGTSGESGRWIVHPEVPAAIPSILLGFQIAVEQLGLKHLVAHTVSTNHRVLSLNRKLGFQATGGESELQMIDGKPVRLVQFEYHLQNWAKAVRALEPMARVAEENIRSWERNRVSPRPG
jgi:RimJ/RimL family protein N-acetyltransferase